ncbi:DJ-1/PfpI family protein [Dactylosporangium sp. NPDC051484]|uniref:DJ-1/PfpI family protein n=1 Tax=Dactylosporangium sp. NPDC051484 TaxID=3154942 RepID=UPI0034508DE3
MSSSSRRLPLDSAFPLTANASYNCAFATVSICDTWSSRNLCNGRIVHHPLLSVVRSGDLLARVTVGADPGGPVSSWPRPNRCDRRRGWRWPGSGGRRRPAPAIWSWCPDGGYASRTRDRDLVSEPVVAWLRAAHSSGARIAAVCTGAVAVGEAALPDCRRCTTHWALTEPMRVGVIRRRADRRGGPGN